MTIKQEFWKTKNYYTVNYFGIIYHREECEMINNFHTIKWYTGDIDDNTYKLHHYYSGDKWKNSITGLMDINEPEPELEKIFKLITKNGG